MGNIKKHPIIAHPRLVPWVLLAFLTSCAPENRNPVAPATASMAGGTTATNGGGSNGAAATPFVALGLGSTGDDFGKDTAWDSSGNLWVAGYFNGTVNFNPSGSTLQSASGISDIFVAKYGTNRSLLWLGQIGGAPRTCPIPSPSMAAAT